MGTALSRLRLSLKAFCTSFSAYEELNKRLNLSPGLPVPGPSSPYWAIPASPIAQHGSDVDVPFYADVVIIGSGITGTAFARTLLGDCDKNCGAGSVQIVMLEARDVCSGASARNGGHITPPLYHDHPALKERHGLPMAKSMIRFRLAHLAELIRVANEENILADSQCREVETFDVFFDQETFAVAAKNLDVYLNDFPEQREMWRVVGVEECIHELQLSRRVVGAIATTAGAIHPYRFVTGILSRLLESYPTNFRLFTHTPCISISSTVPMGGEQLYTVSTSRGDIRTRHIIHATNAWASHLLPPMRGKIIPVRGHMSAQRPGAGLGTSDDYLVVDSRHRPPSPTDSVVTLADPEPASKSEDNQSWLGKRSFVMYSGTAKASRYDYLTQQPSAAGSSSLSPYPPPAAEFMFGGGAAHGETAEQPFMDEVGVTDDRSWNLDIGAYLGGALSMYFGGWGAEGRSEFARVRRVDVVQPEKGRVMKLWTGILGISADDRPWVGRLPAKVTGRSSPQPRSSSRHRLGIDLNSPYGARGLAPPGEWIAAGYSGEGMVHAFLSGKALARMVLPTESGHDEAVELPDTFLVTEARWKKANPEDLVEAFVV
ncbi:FAD dependent oxidoreductase [Mycena sp. CBHHK59/15]|nr:FAD dependent oxidoreductase [Mycena sp. CBHHK59/15]